MITTYKNMLRSADVEGSAPAAPELDGELISIEKARELRAENKNFRLRAKELDTSVKELTSAIEQSKSLHAAEIADLKSSAQTRIVNAEMKRLAVQAGMHDIDGLRMVDLTSVSLNEDGEVIGGDEVSDHLREHKPYLFAQAASASPESTTIRASTTSSVMPAPKAGPVKRKHASDMTEAEYKAERELMRAGKWFPAR